LVDRAVTPRGGAGIIAAITTIATVVCGLLMTAIDPKNFKTVGLGLWWAVVCERACEALVRWSRAT
jgi:hypothetical protein